jgi:hypothetical protein
LTVGPAIDVPHAWAGPTIATLTIALTYLATVDWWHPNNDQEQP